MGLEPSAARQINRARGNVVDRGKAVIAEGGEIRPAAEQPAARRQRGQRNAARQQVGELLQHRALVALRARCRPVRSQRFGRQDWPPPAAPSAAERTGAPTHPAHPSSADCQSCDCSCCVSILPRLHGPDVGGGRGGAVEHGRRIMRRQRLRRRRRQEAFIERGNDSDGALAEQQRGRGGIGEPGRGAHAERKRGAAQRKRFAHEARRCGGRRSASLDCVA